MYKRCVLLFGLVLSLTILLAAQTNANSAGTGTQAQRNQQKTVAPDYSGMYTFLREGEFVQINIEDGTKVTGFISRYGELDSDRGAFLDQFIDKGSLDGNRLTFTTRPLHGEWFEFKGAVERGKGKTPNEEAYYVLRGRLTRNTSDASKQSQAEAREVEFRSFPQDVSNATPHKRD